MTHKEKYNDTVTVDVIIPAYRPGREFGELLHRLEEQEYRPRRILVMNTGEQAGYQDYIPYIFQGIYKQKCILR